MSKDCFATGTKFNHVKKFIKSLSILVQLLGLIFLIIDPPVYKSYWKKLQEDSDKTAADTFHISRRACFHGLALLRNLQVDSHRDKSDVLDGWVAMVYWGNFDGGHLVLPDLQVKLDFKPGDIIFFRSRLLEHFVTDFQGERSSMVFFTHENVLKRKEGSSDGKDS